MPLSFERRWSLDRRKDDKKEDKKDDKKDDKSKDKEKKSKKEKKKYKTKLEEQMAHQIEELNRQIIEERQNTRRSVHAPLGGLSLSSDDCNEWDKWSLISLDRHKQHLRANWQPDLTCLMDFRLECPKYPV